VLRLERKEIIGSSWIFGRSRETGMRSFTSSLVVNGWSCRSEEVGNVAIGVAKVLSSVGEGSLDGWSDESYPGF